MSYPLTAPAAAAQVFVRRPIVVTALFRGFLFVTSTAGAAAPPAGQVSETHKATRVDGDDGLCSTQESAAYEGSFTFRLGSTTAGLSDIQVPAVRQAEPDESVLSACYDEAGTLVQRSGPHTYSMHYTARDRARVIGDRVRFAGSFTAIGSPELGIPYSTRQSGMLVLVDGAPAINRDRLRVRRCLP